MGGVNELQGGSGVNLILSKRFKVGEAPAPFMASELFPMVGLELDRPEWKFLSGERLCGFGATLVATSSQHSSVGLENPTDSGMILVVESILLAAIQGVVTIFDLRMDNGFTPDTRGQGVFLDSRLGDSTAAVPTGRSLFFTSAGAQPGLGFRRVIVEANASVLVPIDVVLGPGGQLWLTQTAQNQQIVFSPLWRERAAEPGELQGAL